MDAKTQAAQKLVQAFVATQRTKAGIAQANAQLAKQQAAQSQAAAAYLQASGGGDETFVWGATGHTVTVKGGVVTVAPPQPVIVSIPGSVGPTTPPAK